MARSLSGTLTTTVNAVTRVPEVAATCEDHIQHFPSYQAPAGSDGYTDACIANDGSIVRVRVTRGSAFTQNFQFQRITTPGTGSQWTSWTTFSGGSGNMFQDGNCAISNNSGTLRAFAQRGTGGNNLWVWTSTNNGSSWTGPVSVLSPPASALTKGISSAGNNDVFFLYDVVGGEAIGCSFISGGVWSALVTWTLATIAGGSGLANFWDSGNSKYWIIYSTGFALKEATCNSAGGGWSALLDIASDSSTAIARVSPRLTFDSSISLYQLVCAEVDGGLLSGSVYSYPRVRQSADLTHWSSGFIVHDITTAYDAKILHRSADSASYLISMPTVMRSADYSQATASQYLDISNYILSYTRHEEINKSSKLEIIIDNNTGALNSKVGTDTSYQPINLNCSVVLNEGYKTGSPPTTVETIKTGTYRINQILFQRSPGENQIKLIAYDKSRNLDIINRYQSTYTSQTISYLIKEVCARAGLFSPNVPGTSQMSQTVSTFVLHSGQTYRTALNEICATYALEYFMDQTETMIFKELAGSDTSVWTYQPEVELLTLGNDDSRANHVIVTGRPPAGGVGSLTTGEAYDDDNAHLIGLERLIHHIDAKLTSNSQCASKATFMMAQEQRAQTNHQITVPANPALQLIDVITLTDYNAPTGTAISGNVRIFRTQVHYETQKGEFNMNLALEGV
jgi:hypothetical protein